MKQDFGRAGGRKTIPVFYFFMQGLVNLPGKKGGGGRIEKLFRRRRPVGVYLAISGFLEKKSTTGRRTRTEQSKGCFLKGLLKKKKNSLKDTKRWFKDVSRRGESRNGAPRKKERNNFLGGRG